MIKHLADYNLDKLTEIVVSLGEKKFRAGQIYRAIMQGKEIDEITDLSKTFREKLKSARMDFAAWLLKTTDFSVSEIGRRSGYESETAFLRTFKDYYGVTPTNYRKEGM